MKRRPNIVLFGDSITEQSFKYGGWGASLTDTYSRKADIVVRGYGGYTTRWALFLLPHIFSLGSTTPPAATTVFFGANDAALPGRTSERQHVPLEEYKENLRKIVHHLKECSATMLIVLITPPPIDEEGRQEHATSVYGEKAMKLPERTNEAAGTYANGCVEVAKELGVSSINLWSKMQETQGWQKKFLRVLKKMVEKLGGRKWSYIAQMLKGRIGKQCRERWHNHLKPDIFRDFVYYNASLKPVKGLVVRCLDIMICRSVEPP